MERLLVVDRVVPPLGGRFFLVRSSILHFRDFAWLLGPQIRPYLEKYVYLNLATVGNSYVKVGTQRRNLEGFSTDIRSC